jgi:hypothetical protein
MRPCAVGKLLACADAPSSLADLMLALGARLNLASHMLCGVNARSLFVCFLGRRLHSGMLSPPRLICAFLFLCSRALADATRWSVRHRGSSRHRRTVLLGRRTISPMSPSISLLWPFRSRADCFASQFARLFPPEFKDRGTDRSVFYHLLRPELVRSFTRCPLVSDVFLGEPLLPSSHVSSFCLVLP